MQKLIPLLITDIPETLEKGETEIIKWSWVWKIVPGLDWCIHSSAAFEELIKEFYIDETLDI